MIDTSATECALAGIVLLQPETQVKNGIKLETNIESGHSEVMTWCLTYHYNAIEHETLSGLIKDALQALDITNIIIKVTPVPATPPKSQEEAKEWTKEYWPSMYKRNNDLGLHHNAVRLMEEELRPNADLWMSLAKEVGKNGFGQALGEDHGCVIVERNSAGEDNVIAAAGDARYNSIGPIENGESGRHHLAHAVMRAIGMVAIKRVEAARDDVNPLAESAIGHSLQQSEPTPGDRMFLDYPVTELEQKLFVSRGISATGYLCLELTFYVSHEPCVMCCMAMLHSRIRCCVFGQRMPASGALLPGDMLDGASRLGTGARSSPRYGLFWRPELNWRFPCWQWIE